MKATSLKARLEEVRKDLETIAGDWNGKDDRFLSGGDGYAEEDAHIAGEGVELIDKLLPVLDNFYNDY